ncbi:MULTISPECIES: hypothetical protein [Pseudomonas putida group]|uniref:hypothetical protein n=1 Tax=Pseudomonas putida group TaxID=136845 RepID=UPI001A9ED2E5|nr:MULTISPECIES: hypothetical protein [Pseudomonas putida group]
MPRCAARAALDLCGTANLQRTRRSMKVAYNNETYRLAFIGVYETKRQMLVIVTLEKGRMLWNFMQCEAKTLNKHRHGELLYKRYTFLPSKEKGHCHQWPRKHA